MLDPALLESILENPSDDLPRLLAADWFDEHGEPERAEYIRLQIANPSNSILSANVRFRQISAVYGLRWADRIWALTTDSLSWRFVRGFISQISCSPRTCYTHLANVLRSWPIEQVQMPGWQLRISVVNSVWTVALFRGDTEGPEVNYVAHSWNSRSHMVTEINDWLRKPLQISSDAFPAMLS